MKDGWDLVSKMWLRGFLNIKDIIRKVPTAEKWMFLRETVWFDGSIMYISQRCTGRDDWKRALCMHF